MMRSRIVRKIGIVVSNLHPCGLLRKLLPRGLQIVWINLFRRDVVIRIERRRFLFSRSLRGFMALVEDPRYADRRNNHGENQNQLNLVPGACFHSPSQLMSWGFNDERLITSMRGLALFPCCLEFVSGLPANHLWLRCRSPPERESEARHDSVATEIHLWIVLVARLVIALIGVFLRLLHSPIGGVVFVLHAFID